MTTASAIERPEGEALVAVRLTVNGEAVRVQAAPRTQLAEILRDHLNLTATHLACEQGVCGACTVFVDGRPERSCLTYAADCEGARVETLEGWKDDIWMERLRAAFTRNHALQCGFCTPGMLATARDLVLRLDGPDEKRIRNELSGNLCRCTGYMGIVASVREVIEQRIAEANAPRETAPAPRPPKGGFAPFEPKAEAEAARPAAPSGQTRVENGWTVVTRHFALAHPAEAVWAHFKTLSAVVACLPGAELTETDGEAFSGYVAVRFGPIAARFEGKGRFSVDEINRTGVVDGRGEDRTGQSSVEGRLGFTVAERGDASDVEVSFRFKIEGRLGQFNRPELVNGLVDYILGEFVANCNAVLAGGQVRHSKGVSALALLRAMLVGFFRRR